MFCLQGLPASELVLKGINPEGEAQGDSRRIHLWSQSAQGQNFQEPKGRMGQVWEKVKGSEMERDKGLKACHVGGHKELAKAFHM